jgi:hypothetical protein
MLSQLGKAQSSDALYARKSCSLKMTACRSAADDVTATEQDSTIEVRKNGAFLTVYNQKHMVFFF